MIELRKKCSFSIVLASYLVMPHVVHGGVSSIVGEPGYQSNLYANVPSPVKMTFDPTGVMYVANSDGNFDPAKIHRVGVGGSPVTEFGVAAIPDPDAVLFDATGLSGAPAGSVLVGGLTTGGGQIVAILPDQSISTVIAPASSTMQNPSDMIFDMTGRMLIMDNTLNEVLVSVGGGTPSTLISLPSAGNHIAAVVDVSNRIFTGTNDGVIRIFDSSGNLLDGSFASNLGRAALALGPGDSLWGSDVYAINTNTDQLLRFDSLGNSTVVASGLVDDTHNLEFGPDGALYVTLPSQNEIYRIVPEPTSLLSVGALAVGIIFRRRMR